MEDDGGIQRDREESTMDVSADDDRLFGDRTDGDNGGGEGNESSGDHAAPPDDTETQGTRATLNVEAEAARLQSLCLWAREGLLTARQADELARLKAGDAIGGVRLAEADVDHGSDTDERLIQRYARMWKRLDDARACVAFLALALAAWPPTLVDVERVYRDIEAAHRRRYSISGDDPNAADTLIAYLAAEARAGHPCPGDILADALGQAVLRAMTVGVAMSKRWPHCPDPFGGRPVPRHVHGAGCVSSSSPASGDFDYFLLVARRSDTAEAVLLSVPDDGDARAIAGVSLLHEIPCDRKAPTMPLDPTGLCPCVRPYAAFLPAFLGSVASVLHIPTTALDNGDDAQSYVLADGIWQLVSALQPMPSLFDAPRKVVDVIDAIDDSPYAWRQAEQLCGIRIEPGQLALALSLAVGERAAAAIDLPMASLADMAGSVYAGPLDTPAMCAEAMALVATHIWRRVCAGAADARGQLPNADRLVGVALALGIVPSDAERAVPEFLCGRLMEPVVQAMMRARGFGTVANVPMADASTCTLGAYAAEAMGVAARLSPDDNPVGDTIILAEVIQQRGGHIDTHEDLSSNYALACAFARTLWPSASAAERDAWTRLYGADPASRPDPADAALLIQLALRMGIRVDDHHRDTAAALCGLLALAVHWPT
ncbi:hypothetical protein pneo_cds_803 [Pandoravirus neocaledonia]|uniref:Uncharacterized protein n=1 Tax=Pandoravirus neocaledonia TaxID=2107708 RepID=A0A2U7UDK5_9VIRU|nr:hypothetical protein pneo_cds_803 [Pandoravirus neocaledonia]AVK76410.1 hypothetical protein pneo_cds_803 [Pandoravirus neocaledonia]